jgi:REP element-mobilizing transposase RayT
MPDHFHAIIEIKNDSVVLKNEPVNNLYLISLGDIIGAFKSIVTVEYIRSVKELGWKPFYKRLWHRNYWESEIRNQNAYDRITQYIKNNPKNWQHENNELL